ncbi:MAG: tripartite tricarboxylate transporter substrate binding protein [Burkholderiales bacterium]|nr:tripartite tricarboxylate transporter substrate binding protein [Burkholderiales bacterium]
MHANTYALAALVGIAAAYAGPTGAQTYPSKPIRYVVPFAPGGGVDTVARVTGARLNAAWGQPVVVENRAGANGILGAELVARSPADGHTLLISSNSQTYNASLYSKLPYDPFKDFAAVSYLATATNLLIVHPSLPVRSVKQLIALARAKPNELTYSSGGVGGGSHLAGELLKSMAKVDILHVPYKGIAPAVSELVGGHVTFSFAVVPASLPHVQAGRLRAIAVSSAARSSLVPELPTVAEAGLPGFDVFSWYGTFVPSGTPRGIVEKLNGEFTKMVQVPEVKSKLAGLGLEVKSGSPEEFARFLKADFDTWDKIIRGIGIRVE